MNLIRLKIITPEKTFFNDDVDIVTVKTTNGYIGIQAGKPPFVAVVEISRLYIYSEKNPKHKLCAISGGLIFVEQQEATIITDAIEWEEDINLDRAKKSLNEVQLILKELEDEYLKSEMMQKLKRAENRIQIKEKSFSKDEDLKTNKKED